MWRCRLSRCFAPVGGTRWAIRAVAIVVAAVIINPLVGSGTSFAAGGAGQTRSYYERDANPKALYLQGEAAGKAASQGIVILDFGRPAVDGRVGDLWFRQREAQSAHVQRNAGR